MQIWNRWLSTSLAVLSVAALAGCPDTGNDNKDDAGQGNNDAGADAGDDVVAPVVDSAAANLRQELSTLLTDHQFIAAKATGEALGGRAGAATYITLLDTNGTELGAAIGSVFGAAAETDFNTIWKNHDDDFVNYTTGVATNNQTLQEAAVNDLTTKYVPEFAQFLAGATGIAEATLTTVIGDHVTQTKEIVDLQAAKSFDQADLKLTAASAHMADIGTALAVAIAAKFPDKFPGDAENPGIDFRQTLNRLLQEHLYAATFATDAALIDAGARSAELTSHLGYLDDNANALSGAITNIFGADAGAKFDDLWTAHNGFFVDYTLAVAADPDDQTKADKAVSDLTTVYVPDFAKFLSDATGLDETAVEALLSAHVLHTKAVVDLQATNKQGDAATADREGALQMADIGDPLAEAIVNAKPEKFQD